jgi:hypothetical protein
VIAAAPIDDPQRAARAGGHAGISTLQEETDVKRIIATFLLAAACLGARATTFGTDATALWWEPAESGWGLNVAQQNDILFITMFAYGPDNQPTWYVGDNVRYARMDGSAMVFTGAWYRTTGPWFGTQFNPNAVGVTPVGTATFTLRTAYAAGFTYNVGATTVTKNLVRQTWAYNRIAGTYVGGLSSRNSGCANPADNGLVEDSAVFTVTQSGAAGEHVTFGIVTPEMTCAIAGEYHQHGSLGRLEATITCNGVGFGSFEAEEIEASASAISGLFRVRGSYCNMDGRLAGARRVP